MTPAGLNGDPQEFIVFCNGLEAGGRVDLARRGRAVARGYIDALQQLESERCARITMQQNYERCLEIIRRNGAPT